MKTCRGCQTEKPLSEFYDRAKSPDGKDPRCKACRRAQNQEWKERNRERNRAISRQWIADHPEESRAHREAYRERRRARLLEHYGLSCVCCHTNYEPHLTIDHVNGDGASHRKELKGRNLYVFLIEEGFPPGYQVLCFNCNIAKHRLGRCACSDE